MPTGKKIEKLDNLAELVSYEVCNSWWAWLFTDGKTQDRIAKYYVKLTSKKLKKYQEHQDFMKVYNAK